MNMKTTTIVSMSVAGLVALISVCVLLVGCNDQGTVALTITPGFVDLSSSTSNSIQTQTQTFTVTGGIRTLSLPIEWSVSNPELGGIAASGGYSASYVRVNDAHGDNSVIAQDQYGAEGVATVHQ